MFDLRIIAQPPRFDRALNAPVARVFPALSAGRPEVFSAPGDRASDRQLQHPVVAYADTCPPAVQPGTAISTVGSSIRLINKEL